MIVELLTEHHLEFLSLKWGCRGSSESTLVKMTNCWKAHATAHMSAYESLTGFLLELPPRARQSQEDVNTVIFFSFSL